MRNLAIEIADVLLDCRPRCEQRSDRSHQLGAAADQLLGSHGEDADSDEVARVKRDEAARDSWMMAPAVTE
jgi:hypothetical protein